MSSIDLLTIPPALGQDIHLWLVDLDEGLEHLGVLTQSLALDEHKADPKYRVCRGVLRQLLGKYLNIPAQQVNICYTQHGKPYIESMLNFSVSHKRQFAMIAITMSGPIGIDLEYKRPINHLIGMSERFLSIPECQDLQNLLDDAMLRRFYEIWVKKEAYTKLVGGQLLKVLAQLRQDQALRAIYEKMVQAPHWLNNDYLYALAIESQNELSVKLFHYEFSSQS